MTAEILSFTSGMLASLLANELGDSYHKKRNSKKSSKVDQEIISKIEKNIRDEFERDCVKENIFKEQYRISKLNCLYDEDDKIQFVKAFFEEHKELKYIHNATVENTIYYYLDKTNEILEKILSDEGKVIVSVIKNEGRKQSNKLSEQMAKNTETVIKKLNEIQGEINQPNTKKDRGIGKKCIGYGKRSRICENIIIGKERYCEECIKLEYFDRIVELYRVQGYTIDVENGYFIATLKSGIIEARAIVFSLFASLKGVSREDIFEVIEKISAMEKMQNYQFIHVVTNGQLSSEQVRVIKSCGAEIFSEEKIISKIMDFTYYLRNSIDEYKNSDISGHYIDLFDEKTHELLEYSIEDFLGDDLSNAFLILGDYGCGKTTFLLHLLYRLAENYIYGDGEYIPLFIQLRDYTKAIDFENLFGNFFAKKCNICNSSHQTFEFLQKCKKFVILFDGFDEVAKRVNYDVKFEVFNEICKYAVGDTKIILTSRPNYFQEANEYKRLIENMHIQFEPLDKTVEFLETYIEELNIEQIESYIGSYIYEFEESNIDIEDVEYLIKNTHDLLDLSKRAFLLNIIVQTLPQLIEDVKKQGESDLEINAASLYKRYIDLWLDREDSKGKTLVKKRDKLHFCKYLAYQMFKEDKYAVHFRELPVEIKKYFSDLSDIEEIDYFSQDIRSCSFLNSDGNGNFKFIHKSFMEYFVACIVCEELEKEDLIKIKDVLNIPNISSEIALFVNDILEENQKKEIVNIIEELLQEAEPPVRENIITILSKTEYNIGKVIEQGDDYQGNDFSHATICNKRIVGVDFTEVSFYSAVIENVIFVNCKFQKAFFQKAKLVNVNFSEQSLEKCDMSYGHIKDCKFCGCSLIDVKMTYAVVEENDFDECDMSGIDTSGTEFHDNLNWENVVGVPYEMK